MHNTELASTLQREGRISNDTANAIKQRFSKKVQSLRMAAFQALSELGEPPEGETPWDLLSEEQVLEEDRTRAAAATSMDVSGAESTAGKGEETAEKDEEGEKGMGGYPV